MNARFLFKVSIDFSYRPNISSKIQRQWRILHDKDRLKLEEATTENFYFRISSPFHIKVNLNTKYDRLLRYLLIKFNEE